jgi:AcrR family transcriptional regulator
MVSTTRDMKSQTPAPKRAYTMRSRAQSVEHTRQEIVNAAFELVQDRGSFMVSLADVSERAGVTIRTILRHFGTREGLFEVTTEYARQLVTEERETPVGDMEAAVRAIVAHYEMRGRFVLRMIEEAAIDEGIATHVEEGRRMHREWVRTVFAPQLAEADDRAEILDLLVIATDVYTWKLLRLDFGLSRARTEQRMKSMLRRLAERGD